MNLAKNRTLHPQLRDEEIVLVENAIRLAIDSIINVLYGVNSARTHEYQRMVADRDKEIQRLECRLGEIEHELQVLRRQGYTCGLFGNEHSLPGSQGSEKQERKKVKEKPQADPGGQLVTEGEHLRIKKRTVPMSELPEEAQRQKRAAWRAASRRYYARKIARQQANPSQVNPFPHIPVSQFSQPMSIMDKRRRTLISELPEESQTLQREAWRAASRRYYARKIARHQTPDPTQYGHLLQT
ncbi:hypothetical protein INR49_002006 [Caranx melampygus]|nr:hypothetical protein INR49_002006 [Caranx melampygus]